ncbi:MAG: carbohydrate-binding domain-containing protein [Kiritimatiellae bacterium]|nr:carbohydrate-binding domain-containing protein [Kiritimatiellia bacterium]
MILRLIDAPSLVHPFGDKAYAISVACDSVGRSNLKLKLDFMEDGDNGDGTPNEIYQELETNVLRNAETYSFWMWIPDANPADSDYISSLEGGKYQFKAYLIDTQGMVVAETPAQPVQLNWGVKPTADLPLTIEKGGQVSIPVEWENMYGLSWENTPLSRLDDFPDRVAVFRSSKTEERYPGQFERVNQVANWLESMGYENGNPLDIMFRNVCVSEATITTSFEFAAKDADFKENGQEEGGNWNLWANGVLSKSLKIEHDGVYEITVNAYGSPCDGDYPLMRIEWDDRHMSTFKVKSSTLQPYTVRLNLSRGTHKIGFRFINDVCNPPADRNLYLGTASVVLKENAGELFHFEAEDMDSEDCVQTIDGKKTDTENQIFRSSRLTCMIPVCKDDTYKAVIRIRNSLSEKWWRISSSKPATVAAQIDNATISSVEIKDVFEFAEREFTFHLSAGEHSICINENPENTWIVNGSWEVDDIQISRVTGYEPQSIHLEAETLSEYTLEDDYTNPQDEPYAAGDVYLDGSVDYDIVFRARGIYDEGLWGEGSDETGWPLMKSTLGSLELGTFEVASTNWFEYSAPVSNLSPGTYRLCAEFTNPLRRGDRKLYLDWIEFRPRNWTNEADNGEPLEEIPYVVYDQETDWTRAAGCANWGFSNGVWRASRIGNSDNILMAGGGAWDRYTVSADVWYNAQDKYESTAELYTRYLDRTNFVKVGFCNFYGLWRVKYTVVTNGYTAQTGWVCDFDKDSAITTGRWYNLKVDVQSGTYQVFVDDQEVGGFTDDHLAYGQVGVGSSASQLGIWEPAKGYYFIDDDEYSSWAPEGEAQNRIYPLNLDYGYLQTFFPTLILPGTYVMSDAEVSNVVTWFSTGMRSLIATDGGVGAVDEGGIHRTGRLEELFGARSDYPESVTNLIALNVNGEDHYVTLDYEAGDSLVVGGTGYNWTPEDGTPLADVEAQDGTTYPAMLVNVYTNAGDLEAPKKTVCFNFAADTYGQLTNSCSLLAQRAFEWSRGQAIKVRLELKYCKNPDDPANDYCLLSTDAWVLGGSGTTTLVMDIPEKGIMTGTNLYWVMYTYPADATNAWTEHTGFYSSQNDEGTSGMVTLAGRGLQLLGAPLYVYAGRAWDMWAAYNTTGSTMKVTFGVKESGDLNVKDTFSDGNLDGWNASVSGRFTVINGELRMAASANNSQPYIALPDVDLTNRNITLEYDASFDVGVQGGGVYYRGYLLNINTNGIWWTNYNSTGQATGDHPFEHPNYVSSITPGLSYHVVVHIRGAESGMHSDVYINDHPKMLDEPLPGSAFDDTAIGFTAPYAGNYVWIDNVRLTDEKYSYAHEIVNGERMPTNETDVTFWGWVPDYDPAWSQYTGSETGRLYNWYVDVQDDESLSDEFVDDVEIYFSPRLMTERSDFPTNITSGTTVTVPVEWSGLSTNELPASVCVSIVQVDGEGRRIGTNFQSITKSAGTMNVEVNIADEAPEASNYMWQACIFHANENVSSWDVAASPNLCIGADDTYRYGTKPNSDKGYPLEPEVSITVHPKSINSSAVYTEGETPEGTQISKSPAVVEGYVDESSSGTSTCLRIVLGGTNEAVSGEDALSLSWGIYYTNGPANLSGMRYLAFSICAAEPSVKIEIEAQKGTRKTMSLGDMGWDPDDSGEWQDIAVPLSSFGFARVPSSVYSPFSATVTLPDRYDMDTVDGETIWVACSQGIVLKSTDSGVTWKAQCIDKSQPSLIVVSFVDADHGWCGSSLGYMYQTEDGGVTWTRLSKRFRVLSQMQFVNMNVGYVADSRGFYRTEDGGSHWNEIADPEMALKKIFFLDEQTGWACGSGGVKRTDDGGESWITQLQTEETGIVDIAMVSEFIGYCTDRSAIYATEDGGATWQAVSAPAESFLPECLAWSDAQHGVVGGYDSTGVLQTYQTGDGGQSWAADHTMGTGNCYDGYLLYDLILSGSNGMVAGANGQLYRSSGSDEGGLIWVDAFPACRELLLKNIRWTN